MVISYVLRLRPELDPTRVDRGHPRPRAHDDAELRELFDRLRRELGIEGRQNAGPGRSEWRRR